MKKTLSELFDLTIEEVRENFNITKAYTWAVNRLQDQRQAILQSGNWIGRQDELMYIDKAIKTYQGNLDEWYSGSNTAVRTKLDESHYDDEFTEKNREC
jgi:hypothetical protein